MYTTQLADLLNISNTYKHTYKEGKYHNANTNLPSPLFCRSFRSFGRNSSSTAVMHDTILFICLSEMTKQEKIKKTQNYIRAKKCL